MILEHSVALFKKKIIQPGTYLIDRKDGSRKRIYIGPERIDRMAESFAAMRKNGLNIPTPWRHDQKAMPRFDMDEQDVNAYQNAGFLKKVWKDTDGALYGEIEVKDRSDASKVGKTVVECSPRIDPEWVDGNGNSYEDAITHLALVTHPVIPGQDNFIPVEEPGMALSLGSYVAKTDVTALPLNLASTHDAASVGVDSVTGSRVGNEGFDTSVSGSSGDVKTAIQALALMGVIIPEDTDLERLPERIVVAAQNFVAGKEQSDDLMVGQSTTKPPKGSKEQRSPLVMSKEFQTIIANQDAIGTKLADGEELTLEYLESLLPESKDEPAQFSKEQEAMLKRAEDQLKSGYRQRLVNLVTKGQVPPKLVKDKFVPLLETIELASQVTNPLDVLLEVAEAIPTGSCLTGKSPTTVKKSKADLFGEQTFSLDGLDEPEGPDFDEPEPTDGPDEAKGAELATQILEMSGIPH